LAKEVIMPKFGFIQEESEILEWIKHEGDKVEKGDPIALVSTDKLSMEIESPETGILSGVKFKVGDKVPVTKIIAYILKPGEKLPTETSIKLAEEKRSTSIDADKVVESSKRITPVANRILKEKDIDIAQVKGSGPSDAITQKDVRVYLQAKKRHAGKINAVPAARRVAKELNVALSMIQGSGPQGRIQTEDVKTFAVQGMPQASPAASLPGEVKLVPLVGMRYTIAQNMVRSMREAPHMTLQVDINMQATEEFRQRASEIYAESGVKISLTVIIAKATAWALSRHPFLNSRLEGKNILLLPSVNLGIAVSLEDGLIVPVIHNAQVKGILDMAREISEFSVRVRENRLRQQDLADGTFTISNLGMYGIDRFSAIINPPQTGILAVGSMRNRFVPDDNNQPIIRLIMTLTLSADHRVVDGVAAAKFLNDIRECLEHPELLSL